MNKSTSLYLDFLRVVAAFGVLLVHAQITWFSHLFNTSLELRNKFVMIFFVLSGYLISFTVEKKNKGSQQYLIDRLSRLYSVVLPALLLTFILDNLGKHINPGFYLDKMAPDHQIFRYLINAIFCGQIWNLSTSPSTNGPFWSLSYEFWYYILFWAWIYLKGSRKIIGLIIICLIIGLKILLLLPVWIFGVLAYHWSINPKFAIKRNIANILFVGTLFSIIFITFFWDFSPYSKEFVYAHPPLFFSSNFIFSWLFGALTAINLWSFNFVSSFIIVPGFIEKIVKKLSSMTFSLYLYHFPMLVFVAAVIPYNKFSYVQVTSILIGIVILVTLLSDVTEKQRNHLKAFIKKIFVLLNKSNASKKLNIR
jgi:peptidoglycan/LPS O-acetylase OafA/YrhL